MDRVEKTLNEIKRLERDADVLLMKLAQEQKATEKKIIELLHGQNELKRILLSITIALSSGKRK